MLTSWFIKQHMPTFSFQTSKSTFRSSFHPRSYQAPILNSAILFMLWWTFTNCFCLCQQSLCPLVSPSSSINMLMSSLSRKESLNLTWLSLCSPHIWMHVFFHSAFSDMAFMHKTWWQGLLCNLQTPWSLLSLHPPELFTMGHSVHQLHPQSPLGIHTWPLILSRLCNPYLQVLMQILCFSSWL